MLVAVFPNPFGLPGGTLGLVPFNLGLTVNWLLEVKINIEGNTRSEVKQPPPWAFPVCQRGTANIPALGRWNLTHFCTKLAAVSPGTKFGELLWLWGHTLCPNTEPS